VQDYYAFGMQMPGRKLSAGYRYGFNGKENDNEVKGEGNQQDYGMRIYDGRIGKFLSVDPLTPKYPELTPFQFASNTPIQALDLDGLEGFIATGMPMGSSGHGHGMIVTPEMANKAPIQVKRIVTDFTPFIGSGLGLYEAYTGEDILTGTKLAWWERALNAIPLVGPIRKSAKSINAIDDLKDVAKAVSKAKEVNKVVAKADNVIDAIKWSKIGSTGKVGEDALKTLGGKPQQYFKTSSGGRYVDQLVDDIAHESKVGYTTLTKGIREQIAKDAELIKNKDVKGAVWHFFESPKTGQGGASKPLMEELKKNGIDFIVHPAKK
jgi:RHS repeat-associated protein